MMPPGVGTPQEGPLTTGLGEILEFELRGPGYSPMQLYQALEWKVAPQLRLVSGIANIDIYGGELGTFEVRVRPNRLQAAGITLADLFSSLAGNNLARGAPISNAARSRRSFAASPPSRAAPISRTSC